MVIPFAPMILRVPGETLLLRAARMERQDFRTRPLAQCGSPQNGSERDLLTSEMAKSEQDSSLRRHDGALASRMSA